MQDWTKLDRACKLHGVYEEHAIRLDDNDVLWVDFNCGQSEIVGRFITFGNKPVFYSTEDHNKNDATGLFKELTEMLVCGTGEVYCQ